MLKTIFCHFLIPLIINSYKHELKDILIIFGLY